MSAPTRCRWMPGSRTSSTCTAGGPAESSPAAASTRRPMEPSSSLTASRAGKIPDSVSAYPGQVDTGLATKFGKPSGRTERSLMKAAIVTLAIGDAYLNRWRAHCESGWSRYAERHGLELIVIDKPLDQTFRAAARSPAWQKCPVLRPDIAGSFDRIIWIDSDVLSSTIARPRSQREFREKSAALTSR